ncbi:Zinc-finger domain-containing protein [Ectothiorhodospira mobilis]|uniref:Zinc-finger domain-containing protein n=2 Tax=Ectothiorhodospira mobilis TaxID=195064 RepID=A0A1I4S579_ECTMO|nr:zinc-finger domain-containing protein [Ectothiorhodospira mobilis]MCG5534592.1 zinc-finger domain-containing protein [Ectothiorhodospira mobilis]SFM59531.1 Zinc-finger domain-containing protein [Ectothiorhodospira mobilis]
MPNPQTALEPGRYTPACRHRRVRLTAADLPLCCPRPDEALWNAHPRVYLPIEDAPDGRILCPYCSTEFILEEGGGHGA